MTETNRSSSRGRKARKRAPLGALLMGIAAFQVSVADEPVGDEDRIDCSRESPRWCTNCGGVFNAPRGFESSATGTSYLYEKDVSETGEEVEREVARVESGYFAPGTFADLDELDIEHHLGHEARVLAGAAADEQSEETIWTYVVQRGDASTVLTSTFEVDVGEFLRCFYVSGQPDPAVGE